ncbi:MAG: hypothetical protein Q9166_001597 [cf. Caloplaca sp. 2 TL-2023]
MSALMPRGSNNIPIPNTPLNETNIHQHWSQQNPELAPALPIIGLSESYIQAALNESTQSSIANVITSSNLTARMAAGFGGHNQRHSRFHRDTSLGMLSPLVRRGEAEHCSVGDPCADKR